MSDHSMTAHKPSAEAMRQLLDAPFITYGSLQGVLYDWAFGAKLPFILIRELSKGALVRCNYDVHDSKIYHLIHTATKRQHTTIHVYGDIKWDKATNNIIDIATKNIEVADSLSETDFYKIFGSMPSFTGDLSTSDYIDWLRGDGEYPVTDRGANAGKTTASREGIEGMWDKTTAFRPGIFWKNSSLEI